VNQTLLLFAQQKGPPPEAAAIAFAVICFYLVILVGALALQIWFLVTAYKALNAVSPRNRDMEPGMIFLIFIPLFGIVWYFFIVIRIADAFAKEFDDRGLRSDGDFGKLIGILAPLIPCVGLIMHIMWIMKVRGYTARLAGGGSRKRIRDDDDDEDDRPRKKKRSRSDDEDDD